MTANQAGSVTASYGGVSQALTVTVRPIRVATLTLSPNPVDGGANAIGIGRARVRRAGGWNRGHPVEQQRGGGGADGVEHHHSGGWDDGHRSRVRTSAVTANTNVNIYATVYGVRKTAALTVRP